MAEDSQVPALPRRVPRDKQEPTTGRPAAQLPESVVHRILSVLDGMRADASPQDRKVQAEQPAQHHAAPSKRPPSLPRPMPGTSNEGEPDVQIVRQVQPASSPGIPPEEAPTVPLAAIPASASGVTEADRVQPDIAAQPGPEAPVGHQFGHALPTREQGPPYGQFRLDDVPAGLQDAPASPEEVPAHRESMGSSLGKAQASRAKLLTRPPGPARPKASGGRHRRIIRGVILAIALLSAGSLVFLLTWRASTVTAPNGNLTKARSVVAIRDRAAAWVAAQVSRTAMVACDRIMCQALEARGIPAVSLLELRPGQADPLRSRVLVVTAAVRSMIKSRLVTTYAPAAIAGFGSGSAGISIRVIAPRGAAAYSSSLRADMLARRAAGAQLLQNQQISLSAGARRQLGYGQIDSRLLAIIASLAARRMVSVVSFGDLAAGASPGVPCRSADLAAPSGMAGPDPAGQVQWMAAFLRAQRAPYLAANIQTVRLAGGRIVLRIEFAAPSPLGLLAASVQGR
jgi:hypothetical protein